MDRILEIINKLSSDKYNKQLVEDAVTFLESHSSIAIIDYLVKNKDLDANDATNLVFAINKEWNVINKQSILLYAITFLLLTMVWIGGILIDKPVFILVGVSGCLGYIYSIFNRTKEIKKRKQPVAIR